LVEIGVYTSSLSARTFLQECIFDIAIYMGIAVDYHEVRSNPESRHANRTEGGAAAVKKPTEGNHYDCAVGFRLIEISASDFIDMYLTW
jgi:hypothetical protein